MKTRYFALVMGLVFLVIGGLGFVPGLRTVDPEMPPLALNEHYGLLFGLFPVNWLHNLVHLLYGVWGVLAWRTLGAARVYAVVVALSYAVLTVLGLFPALATLAGLVPLFGNDVWLHAAIALVAAIFASLREPVRSPSAGPYAPRR